MIYSLNMTNEEAVEWFRKEILNVEPDPEFKRRIEEYYQNIERDFQEEWSKKHFKWLFTKRRQKKLRVKVARRYTAPVFWLIEEVVDDILVKQWQTNDFFDKFVDFKDVASDDKNYFVEEDIT